MPDITPLLTLPYITFMSGVCSRSIHYIHEGIRGKRDNGQVTTPREWDSRGLHFLSHVCMCCLVLLSLQAAAHGGHTDNEVNVITGGKVKQDKTEREDKRRDGEEPWDVS